MKVTVVYDSVFGNTKLVAEEIGKELGEDIQVESIKAFNFEKLRELDLIFIGSPTRIFKPTKDITELVKSLHKYNSSLKVACFDTRMHITENEPWILRKLEKRYGYATDTMIKILSRKKQIHLHKPIWFYVGGAEGPILEEELSKIKEWIKEILV